MYDRIDRCDVTINQLLMVMLTAPTAGKKHPKYHC